MEFLIPQNPGLEPLPKDERDFEYSAIFGEEKYPRKFKRELPAGMNIPYQMRVPACVNCAFTFANQFKSRVNDNNDVDLSWRDLHAKTGEYNRGRHLRVPAKRLQSSGQPQDKYCEDNALLPEKEFMAVNLSAEGELDALKRRIGAYSFITPILDKVCQAVIKEPIIITLGGHNDDWRKPFNEIVRQTKSPKWYHAIVLWDYNLDEGWLGVYNWWNDGYRRISIDYLLTGALSFRDLPDNDNIMMKLIGLLKDGKKTDQFAMGIDGVHHKLNSVSMLEELHNAGQLNKNSVEWKEKLEGIIGSEWVAAKGD